MAAKSFAKKMEVLDAPSFSDRQPHQPQQARTIDDVLRDGYQFRFGDYLGEMFKLFGKTWGRLLGHSGILMGTYMVIYICGLIFFFGFIADTALSGGFDNRPDPSLMMSKMMSTMMWLMIIVYVYFLLWVLPFRAGIYTHLEEARKTGVFTFGTFFIALKTKWLKLVGLGFILFLLTYALGMVTYISWLQKFIGNISTMTQDQNAFLSNPLAMYEGMGWVFLSYIPGIFFMVSCSLAIPLLLFQTDNVMHAVVSSMKIVMRKWFYFFALYILITLLTMSGIIVCGIGMLLTIQFFPIVIYVIYEDIFVRQANISVDNELK